MPFKLVIFDFDGTLADTFPWFTRVLNGVADRYGFDRVQANELDLLRGYDARRIMRHLRVPGWKLPFIANHMRKLMERDIAEITPFDGVPAMLRTLAERGVTVAIVSSNSVDNVRSILGPDSAKHVAHYACGASIFGKPAKFRQVLGRTGIRTVDALAIGDELRDIAAARRVGIPFGAVSWGYTRPDALALECPDILFHNVDDIAAAVL